MSPAAGACIALFMVLAAVLTPQAPPGGIGLRADGSPAAAAPGVIRAAAVAREPVAPPVCERAE
jgi:hypothetical protein